MESLCEADGQSGPGAKGAASKNRRLRDMDFGLPAAWLLDRVRRRHLYEKLARIGGLSHTALTSVDGGDAPLGSIVVKSRAEVG
jgi:hypothetical protein